MTILLQHKHKFFSPLFWKGLKAEGFTSSKAVVLNYFDKIHPVVSVMTSSPSLKACPPPPYTHWHSNTHSTYTHTLSQGRRSSISAVLSMKDIYGWSRVSQGFVLGRVQLFVSATFKANVHEHEHEASWVTGPLKSSTMVLPIIHSAQCSCGISYMALFVFVCVLECVFGRFTCLRM